MGKKIDSISDKKLYTEQVFFRRTTGGCVETMWLTFKNKWHAEHGTIFNKAIKQQIGEVASLWG
jgi:hypothetical protein